MICSIVPFSSTKKSSCVRKLVLPKASCNAFKIEVFPTLLQPVKTVILSNGMEISFNPRNPEILISAIFIDSIFIFSYILFN